MYSQVAFGSPLLTSREYFANLALGPGTRKGFAKDSSMTGDFPWGRVGFAGLPAANLG